MFITTYLNGVHYFLLHGHQTGTYRLEVVLVFQFPIPYGPEMRSSMLMLVW
jgi:hypothetical protein